MSQLPKALIIGDFHIPGRSSSIPTELQLLLSNNKFDQILCTGNLYSKQTFNFLRSLSSDVHIVRGDFDNENLHFPREKVVNIGGFKFGLIHGHEVLPWGDFLSLSRVKSSLGVDVLISGHTHQLSIVKCEGGLLVNPGSVTGAFSGFELSTVPSFLIFEVKNNQIVFYSYKLNGTEVSVEMFNYEKEV